MSSFRMSSIQYMTNYKSSLNKTYQEQAKILEQGDGTSIHRGSDDPIGYSKLLRYNVSDSENDQYQKNVKTGISWMQTSDSVVANISDRMKTFSEKTIAAANSYNTDADFQSIAKEMFAQIEEIVAESNTQQGDRYVFSGQKDTTEPFVLSHDTYDRGLAKTLDSKQAAFFKNTSGDDNATLYQMLTLELDNETYYLDTQSGYLYTKDFVDSGYKELIAQGYTSINETDKISSSSEELAKTYAAGKLDDAAGDFKVSQAFTNRGLLRDDINGGEKKDYLDYDTNASGSYTVTGINIKIYSVDSETHEVTEEDPSTFKFTTVKQRMVNYMGDNNYISMVKMNGANDKSSDVVNLNGKDLYGCDIFDDADSGWEQSGCAMLNNMLTVYTFTTSSDPHWLTSDGVTISDVSHATVTVAETTLGSRLNLYNSVSEMLDNQSTTITNDITNVSGTDIANLATRLMEITTLYNMSLSLGGRVLPQSLADYL